MESRTRIVILASSLPVGLIWSPFLGTGRGVEGQSGGEKQHKYFTPWLPGDAIFFAKRKSGRWDCHFVIEKVASGGWEPLLISFLISATDLYPYHLGPSSEADSRVPPCACWLSTCILRRSSGDSLAVLYFERHPALVEMVFILTVETAFWCSTGKQPIPAFPPPVNLGGTLTTSIAFTPSGTVVASGENSWPWARRWVISNLFEALLRKMCAIKLFSDNLPSVPVLAMACCGWVFFPTLAVVALTTWLVLGRMWVEVTVPVPSLSWKEQSYVPACPSSAPDFRHEKGVSRMAFVWSPGWRIWSKPKPIWRLESSLTQLNLANPLKVKVLVAQSCLTLSESMDCKPTRFLCPWNSLSKNTGCHSLLPRIFLTHGSNLGLPCTAGRLFTIWATKGSHKYVKGLFLIATEICGLLVTQPHCSRYLMVKNRDAFFP